MKNEPFNIERSMSKEGYIRFKKWLDEKGLVLTEPIPLCKDCELPYPRMFKLIDELWEIIADNIKDVLCMECVIKRLNRPLKMEDFDYEWPINKEYILLLSGVVNYDSIIISNKCKYRTR